MVSILKFPEPQPKLELVPPPKQKDDRDHFWLYEREVEKLIAAAKSRGRQRLRDGTLILSAFTHGLRCQELVNLKWNQVDFSNGNIFIKRCKKGIDSTHPIKEKELRAFRQLQRDNPDSPYIFTSKRKAQI